jgi:cyclophilin family peptidyl-prolyl cis-trans isomerase
MHSPLRPIFLLLPFALFLTACGGLASGPRSPGPGSVAEIAEDPGTLLLLADRRMYEPFSVRRLAEGREAIRAELALALGRIGDPRGVPTLEGLLQDPAPAVRRRAAFALGFVKGPSAVPALLAAVGDHDLETGRRVIEALARLETPLASVEAGLLALPEARRGERLLPSLFRFAAADRAPAARRALATGDPDQVRWAAYALAREARPESREVLRGLLEDPDPWLRGWGARGLGQAGTAADAEALVGRLADPAAGPVIQALRGLAALAAEGRALPPRRTLPTILELLDHPLPGVRITAIEATPAWLGDPELAAVLAERFTSGEGREREVALLALARGGDERALDLLPAAMVSPDSQLRARSVEAAAALDALDRVAELAADPHPVVREAWLTARLGSSTPGIAAASALSALMDADPAVRAVSLAWLSEHPKAPTEAIIEAMNGPGAERLVDVRLSGISALAARARSVPEERESLIDRLLDWAGHRDWLVRRAAAGALEKLGAGRLASGPVETGWSIAAYRQAVARTREDRRVDLETRHGVLRLRLTCSTAPLTCLNFVNLVTQGFYDGLTFHRVVPDFVVQAGDPRGDGAGGPGYTLRDEYNLERYARGTLGMALSGPDTAGSQFFITLSRQPHLDGTYTAFGRVESGEEILDLLVQGDRILRMSEVQAAAPGSAVS